MSGVARRAPARYGLDGSLRIVVDRSSITTRRCRRRCIGRLPAVVIAGIPERPLERRAQAREGVRVAIGVELLSRAA